MFIPITYDIIQSFVPKNSHRKEIKYCYIIPNFKTLIEINYIKQGYHVPTIVYISMCASGTKIKY